MEQDGSNPIRINCVILNFNDGETVARLVHMTTTMIIWKKLSCR